MAEGSSSSTVLKQNPFSFYDFLGYFTPGAIVLYGALAAWQLVHPGQGDLSSLIDRLAFDKAQLLLPFAIAAYAIGHIVSFISSITVERYSIWAMGYPSRYLLREGFPKYWEVNSLQTLRWSIRLVVAGALLPLTLPDWVLGHCCKLRSVYAKQLDELLCAIIGRKKDLLVAGAFDDGGAIPAEGRDSDSFRLVYHWAVENAPNHLPKMQNYVALYGFLRTLTLIGVMAFWVAIPIAFSQCLGLCTVVLIEGGATCVTYTLFMAFVKFYRRFSLEALMALAVAYPGQKSKHANP